MNSEKNQIVCCGVGGRALVSATVGIAMAVLLGGSQAVGQAYSWNTVSGGSWNTANWVGTGTTASFPNGFNDTAVVSRDITTNTTINLNTAITLNSLSLGDSNNTSPSGYVIAPNGGSLTFRTAQTAANRPFITSTSGANAITAPITADNAAVTISNTGGGTLSLSSIARVRGGGYRFSDTNTTVASGGGLTSANGIGNVFAVSGTTDWVTYDPGTGAVGAYTAYLSGTAAMPTSTATNNVNLSGNATLSANSTMNSFRWTGSTSATLTLGAFNMRIESGGFLRPGNTTNFDHTINATSGTMTTPVGVPLTVWNFNSNRIQFNAPLQVDGLNNMGTGPIEVTNASSTFGTGDINVLQNSVTFTYAAPSLSNNVNVANGGEFLFIPAASSTMTLSGTVTVNGSLGGNFNGFYAIDTLQGFGGFTRPVTVLNTLAPGDGGAGTLGISSAGPFTLGASSTYRAQLGGTTPGDGPGFYDQVNVGADSLFGPINVTLNAGAALDVSLIDGFIPQTSDSFFIFTRQGVTAWTTTFAGLPEGASVSVGSYTGTITYQANWTGSQATSTLTGGNDVAIYSVAVPEPGTMAMLALGGLTLAGIRRRLRFRLP